MDIQSESQVPKEPRDKRTVVKILAVFLLFIIAVVLILLILIGKNLTKREEIAQREDPRLTKINKIISEFENPSQALLDKITPEVWQIQKESVLDGTGDPNTESAGLNDIRDAIKNGRLDLAKKRMSRNLFNKLATPLPTKDGGSESFKILSSEEINKYDPQRVFFDRDIIYGRVSEPRLELIVKFIELYYNL